MNPFDWVVGTFGVIGLIVFGAAGAVGAVMLAWQQYQVAEANRRWIWSGARADSDADAQPGCDNC